MDDEALKARAIDLGLDWEEVKKGLGRLMPIIETIARLTPNKVDDAAVAFLKSLLAE